MFPTADARGRVVGFGARATAGRRARRNTSTPRTADVYHKREVLFGVDLARATAAREARMVLVEGYTDVLALHQAGIRNAVGIMGTSLTDEQLRELERIAKVLELCLDADRAGQDAMLRAARAAAGRRLELRVVPLPAGTDPADLLAADDGPEQLQTMVAASQPFTRFQVERILDRGSLGSAEGRDRALAELAPVLAALGPSSLRDELMRTVAGRLELPEGRLEARVAEARGNGRGAGALARFEARPEWSEASGAGSAVGRGGSAEPGGVAGAGGVSGPAASQPPDARRIDPAIRTERDFLVLCVALPEAGRRALAAIDPDTHLTSEQLRRAARHLAGQPELPFTGLASDDEQLARIVTALVARAGEIGEVTPEQIEQQRLMLELARLDRALLRARSERQSALQPALARERESVLEAIRTVGSAIERAV